MTRQKKSNGVFQLKAWFDALRVNISVYFNAFQCSEGADENMTRNQN